MKIMSQYKKQTNKLIDVEAKYKSLTHEDREVELKMFSSFTLLFLMAN